MPRIYVASLSDYNNGVLHGAWIDIDDTTDVDEVWEQINAMLAAGAPGAEEWAIHDHEDWGGLYISEYADLNKLVAIGNRMAGPDDIPEAVAAYVNNEGWDYIDADSFGDGFDEAYAGCFTSVEDYAYDYIESTGMLHDLPESLQSYFDYEKFGNDLVYGGDIWVHEAGWDETYVFYNT